MLWISDDWKDYEVLDASNGERLERWGDYILVRPDPQVIWNTPHAAREWKRYDARYIRSNTGGGHWSEHRLPERWQIRYKDYLTFNVKPMNFKHTGVFPEQAANWDFIREKVASAGRPVRVLNLFAYSGGLMDEVVTTNRHTVTVARHLPYGEFWMTSLDTCSNGTATTVDGVETIGIQVVRHTARTTDTRDHGYLMSRDTNLCHGFLQCHADSMITTTRTELYILITFKLTCFHNIL